MFRVGTIKLLLKSAWRKRREEFDFNFFIREGVS